MHVRFVYPRWRMFAILAATAIAAGMLTATPRAEAHDRPNFKMPFLCGHTWTGNNWDGHDPPNSVDWNHYDANGNPDDFGRRVLASAGGKVLASHYSTSTGYGKVIVIGHGNGWRTRYAHLSERLVAKDQIVRQGQVIGRVGKSSAKYNLSPHLHYEQIHHGTVVNSVVQGVLYYDFLKRRQTSRNGC